MRQQPLFEEEPSEELAVPQVSLDETTKRVLAALMAEALTAVLLGAEADDDDH
jgi:hypothetical protein